MHWTLTRESLEQATHAQLLRSTQPMNYERVAGLVSAEGTARAVKPWSSLQCTGIHHAVRTYEGDEHVANALNKSMVPLSLVSHGLHFFRSFFTASFHLFFGLPFQHFLHWPYFCMLILGLPHILSLRVSTPSQSIFSNHIRNIFNFQTLPQLFTLMMKIMMNCSSQSLYHLFLTLLCF